MQIKYYNSVNKSFEIEQVYGASGVEFLYQTFLGKLIGYFLEFKPFSKIYGYFQSKESSQKKVLPFIEKFNIKIDQFEKELVDDEVGYSSFNKFFCRKLKAGQRPFPKNQNELGAFCEARYFAHNHNSEEINFPVKGKYINPVDLLKNNKWSDTFKNGSFVIARLCPVDYHRFHFPDNGEVLDFYEIHDRLISVNPIALKVKPETFIRNERHVTIMQTENFGKLAYIEVGAICVGKIVQSHSMTIGSKFKKGQEKGYFLFGGSTVIVLGEKEKIKFNKDFVSRSKEGIETYYQLGNIIN